MKRTILAVVCGVVFALGCAAGVEGDGDDGFDPDAGNNNNVVIDANHNLPIDANPLPIDANIPIDASLPIDAATLLGEGEACTTSSQCATSCCLISLMACFEDPGFPGFCS